ncbi:MAG: nuclear transport factor 2 family protein [Taibaiella sp.]|nr:nuclear transport factor 2 family protein [Taibaiella sp.]
MKKYLCLIVAVILFPFSQAKSNSRLTPKDVFEHFVAAVNRHDGQAIANFLTGDHRFINAAGNELKGIDTVKAEWQDYFAVFANYKVEISQIFTEGNKVAAFGSVAGTVGTTRWEMPASWRAEITDGKLAELQLYSDTKLPFDLLVKNTYPANPNPRATSIGGIFFKCVDVEKTRAWYKDILGLNIDKYGTTFEWRQAADPGMMGYTQWSPFKSTTKYFEPSTKEFMINYRVTHIEALVEKMQKAGVTVTDKIESFEYGKFVHVMDCDGNKLELWEPNDEEYGKILGVKTN